MKNIINIFALVTAVVAALMTGSVAGAAGTMNLKGKLRAITAGQVRISDLRNNYEINLDKISATDKTRLAHAHTGDSVELWVPFDAIVGVSVVK